MIVECSVDVYFRLTLRIRVPIHKIARAVVIEAGGYKAVVIIIRGNIVCVLWFYGWISDTVISFIVIDSRRVHPVKARPVYSVAVCAGKGVLFIYFIIQGSAWK